MNLKNRRIYGIVLAVIGVATWVLAFLLGGESDNSNYIGSFGAGLAVIGILRIVQSTRLLKNTERAADYEAMQKDERTVFIANKARSVTLAISIIAQCVAALIAYFVFGNELVQKVLLVTTCFQALIYYFFWIIYNKKY